MTKSLRLTVLTPAETLLDVAEVAWVQVQLSDGGGIGIYPGHAPLLAETITAPLRYADGLGEHVLDLEAGILQVERGGVTIFTILPAVSWCTMLTNLTCSNGRLTCFGPIRSSLLWSLVLPTSDDG